MSSTELVLFCNLERQCEERLVNCLTQLPVASAIRVIIMGALSSTGVTVLLDDADGEHAPEGCLCPHLLQEFSCVIHLGYEGARDVEQGGIQVAAPNEAIDFFFNLRLLDLYGNERPFDRMLCSSLVGALAEVVRHPASVLLFVAFDYWLSHAIASMGAVASLRVAQTPPIC